MSRYLLIAFLVISPIHSAVADDMIIFLHNAFYENNKDGQSHPKFGTYDFIGIVKALENDAKVIAPVRNGDTSVEQAALTVVNTVKAALLRGTKPSEIKIIGASKGAYIAMIANQNLSNKDLSWVIVGGCSNRLEGSDFRLNGQVLSIYETSDSVAGSCTKDDRLIKTAARFEEVMLLTGKDHSFQFAADPAWIEPALKW